tara:strand:- start:179 stop:1561 length:1383 start_codon:yes stop_codon:yes gene_type:complete
MGFDMGMIGSALGGIMGGQQQAAGTAQTREVTKSLANVNDSAAMLQSMWGKLNDLNDTTPPETITPATPMASSAVQNNAGGKPNQLYGSTLDGPAAQLYKNNIAPLSEGVLPMPNTPVIAAGAAGAAGAADGGHIKAKHYAADGGSVGAGKRPATLADVMAYSNLDELPMAADGGSVDIANPVNNGVINKDFVGPPRPLAPPTKSQTSNRDHYADIGKQRRALSLEIQRVAMGIDPQTAIATKQMLQYDNQQTALGYTSGAVSAYGRGDTPAAADLMNKYSANSPVDFGDTWSSSEDGLLTVTNGDGETNQMGVDQLLDWQIANLATPDDYYASLTKRMEVDMHPLNKDKASADAFYTTAAGLNQQANAAAGGTARGFNNFGKFDENAKLINSSYESALKNYGQSMEALGGIDPAVQRGFDTQRATAFRLTQMGYNGADAWLIAGMSAEEQAALVNGVIQ